MRTVAASMAILIIIACSMTGAYGGNHIASRDMSQFANEIASKFIYPPNAKVSVQASDCHLQIKYGTLQVAFDMPLKGTKVVENEMEDGIIISNANMTRTIRDRQPETFDRIILKFDKKSIKNVMKTFENVISACSGG